MFRDGGPEAEPNLWKNLERTQQLRYHPQNALGTPRTRSARRDAWAGDNPSRRAGAETCRGPASLSATIRRFSSADQRRCAPVWITSRRDTFDIVVCSVIRLCLLLPIPQRKA